MKTLRIADIFEAFCRSGLNKFVAATRIQQSSEEATAFSLTQQILANSNLTIDVSEELVAALAPFLPDVDSDADDNRVWIDAENCRLTADELNGASYLDRSGKEYQMKIGGFDRGVVGFLCTLKENQSDGYLCNMKEDEEGFIVLPSNNKKIRLLDRI